MNICYIKQFICLPKISIKAIVSGIALLSLLTDGSNQSPSPANLRSLQTQCHFVRKICLVSRKSEPDSPDPLLRLRGGNHHQPKDSSEQDFVQGDIRHINGKRSNQCTDISSSDLENHGANAHHSQQTWSRKVGVQGTNDDSTMSKWSAAEAGYFDDEFLRYFVLAQSPRRRRAPLINRGYAARVLAMRAAVRSFVQAAAVGAQTPTVQVVNLGCGFDTTYLQLKMEVCPAQIERHPKPSMWIPYITPS
jgi:hypothetical protein